MINSINENQILNWFKEFKIVFFIEILFLYSIKINSKGWLSWTPHNINWLFLVRTRIFRVYILHVMIPKFFFTICSLCYESQFSVKDFFPSNTCISNPCFQLQHVIHVSLGVCLIGPEQNGRVHHVLQIGVDVVRHPVVKVVLPARHPKVRLVYLQ